MNETTESIVYIPLEKIVPNRYQPRTTMNEEELQKLAGSIQNNGMLQKPSARLLADGCCELAFGHRRFEAYKRLAEVNPEYKSMPLIIRQLSDLQMLDFAWDENNDREDLNPLDEANAYAIYMREFGKTSKEAAEHFSRGNHTVAEETVRAKIRLLNLAPAAQEKMRAGVINETTGRALLSMQKVAPTAIEDVVRKIEKSKGEALPEDVIERELQRAEGVFKMWDSDMRSEGKPRSSYRDGWLLDMKNFPNKLLPALTYREVIDSIHTKDDMQLIELVNLNSSFHGLLEVLKQLNHPAAAIIEHLLNPTACTACPFYTKVRGTHYCGIKACHARKTVAWNENAIQQASKSLGIAIYEKATDGAYAVLSTWDDKHKKLFDTKHKDLRLIRANEAGGNHYQSFKGIDDGTAFVVVTGPTLAKMASAKSGNIKATGGLKKSDKEKLEMRRMKIYRARRKDLTWAFTDATKQIFDGVLLAAIEQLIQWKFVGMDDRIPEDYILLDDISDDEKENLKRRELIWHMVVADASSHFHREPLAYVLQGLQRYSDEWGVKLPKSIYKLATEFDGEIEAVTLAKAAK